MSENWDIYTAGKNFTLPPAVTAVTNLTSGITPGHPWQNPWTEQQLLDIYCTPFLNAHLNSLSHYDYPNYLQKYWFLRSSSWMIHWMWKRNKIITVGFVFNQTEHPKYYSVFFIFFFMLFFRSQFMSFPRAKQPAGRCQISSSPRSSSCWDGKN